MVDLSERSQKIKVRLLSILVTRLKFLKLWLYAQKRALKLQQSKQHEALLREQAKDRELEREKQLIARPAKRN